jgi:uncharacterized protein
MAAKEQTKASGAYGRCPICGAPVDMAYRPFCSARCRDVDLARWLRGSYAIPGGEGAAEDEKGTAPAKPHASGEDDETPE